MKTIHVMVAAAVTATTILSGCASTSQDVGSSPYPVSSYPASSSSYASYYGVVDSIHVIAARSAGGVGVGAVIGGVVGGLLGNQVGGGTGKDVATVAGVVGGAIVGNQIQQNNRAQSRDTYEISVRLDSGSYQTVAQDSLGDLRVGNRARIENGRVYRY